MKTMKREDMAIWDEIKQILPLNYFLDRLENKLRIKLKKKKEDIKNVKRPLLSAFLQAIYLFFYKFAFYSVLIIAGGYAIPSILDKNPVPFYSVLIIIVAIIFYETLAFASEKKLEDLKKEGKKRYGDDF